MHDDAAVFHDIAAGGDAQGLVGVLFHQKNSGAVGIDLADDVKDLLDDDGGEAQRRFVQQEQFGTGHEGAADGEHLLFPAGKRAAQLAAAFGQDGEEAEDVVLVLLYSGGVFAQESAQVQIFAHAQVGKDQAAFGHLRDAQSHYFVRRQGVDGLAVPEYFALAGPVDAANGHKRGGFAGAVGPDERGDVAFLYGERNIAQGLDIAVVGIHMAELKHRFLPGKP